METHLIIGIGGTGGRIIHSIKSVIEQNHGTAPDRQVNIDFLYVDTSHTDLDNSLKWKEKTASIALTPANIVRINKMPMDPILKNIDAYPNIKPWIGNAPDWQGSLKPGEVAAAQMRRYGRFLLAGDINKFIESLNAIVRNLIDRTPDKVRNITFHICCGLAGGTGSGMVVDIIAQIRKNYPFEENLYFNSIFLYTLLPELTPTSWAAPGGLYHANGYACLKELNDLSLLNYIPHDLADETRQGLRVPSPAIFFNGCYVFTNENENNVLLNVEDEIPPLVGNYIYKLIYSINNPEARAWIYRLARCENDVNTPEGNPPKPENPIRGKRFILFGIKRIGIPEVEIKSHFTAMLGIQAILQLLYNRWYDGQGYIDEPKTKEFNAFVSTREHQERWLLSDGHTILSEVFLPSDKEKSTWATFGVSWERKRNDCGNIITTDIVPKTEWIIELKKRYALYFTETFRGEGVQRFFQLREKDISDTVRYIVEHIDNDLFNRWNNAEYGLIEIGYLLNGLISYLEGMIGTYIGQKVVRLRTDEKTYADRVSIEDAAWDRIGWMREMAFRERTRSFERQNHNLELLYRVRTELAGWEYAQKLLPEVIQPLNALYARIFSLQASLNAYLQESRELVDKTCRDTHPRVSDHFVKFYDSAMVRDLAKELTLNMDIQKSQTASLRATIEKKLDGVNTFNELNRKISVSDFSDLFEKHTEKTITAINEQMKDIVDGGKKILNVSITEKLKESYGSNKEELQHFIRDLVNQAAVFGKYDPVQEHLDKGSSRHMEFMVVLPPDARPNEADPNSFNYMMANAFKTSRGAGIQDRNIIYTEPRHSEIVLINIHNLFPLRFLEAATALKTKYLNAINNIDAGTARRSRITLHSEGGADDFHDLFVVEKNRQDYLRYIVIADNAGVIVRQPDPETEELQYILRPEKILGESVLLGKDLMQSYTSLTPSELDLLQDRVNALLKKDYKAISKQAELTESITAKLSDFLASKGNNLRDSEFIKYKGACNDAIGLIGAINNK